MNTLPTRDEMIVFLRDEIVSGTEYERRIDLAYVLDEILDLRSPLLDAEDTANLITGDTETRLDILSRAERTARDVVDVWLHTRDGKAFVDRQMEKAKEEAEEETE
jgi:hypothetical protein